jgi:hypothetical protein
MGLPEKISKKTNVKRPNDLPGELLVNLADANQVRLGVTNLKFVRLLRDFLCLDRRRRWQNAVRCHGRRRWGIDRAVGGWTAARRV